MFAIFLPAAVILRSGFFKAYCWMVVVFNYDDVDLYVCIDLQASGANFAYWIVGQHFQSRLLIIFKDGCLFIINAFAGVFSENCSRKDGKYREK